MKALGRLDSGIGGAIAILSAQVDDLTRALKSAQETARESAGKLESQTKRADAACRQLELLMAALHDLPPSDTVRPPKQARAAAATRVSDSFPSARPLSRWNTNRLQSDAESDAEGTAANGDIAPDQASRAGTLEPVERPMKRSRSRVVRRRRRIEASA
ncbi:hypothetical protein [Pararhodobacter sp. SW119]|uniref:hypothetical protein n=1 Tax=Pararhodobacter sp. SW119 TaxID=2780075 RepID=UPI001ADFF82C|nr:hypothetical protein [Pararhodobacter sp. SW119]